MATTTGSGGGLWVPANAKPPPESDSHTAEVGGVKQANSSRCCAHLSPTAVSLSRHPTEGGWWQAHVVLSLSTGGSGHWEWGSLGVQEG